MCGIAGVFNLEDRYSAEEMSLIISTLTDSMRHRGPDDRGVWVSPDGRCALGHRRLSIIDVSSAARQPMTADSGAVITYNGELYNYLDLRADLLRTGTRFHTRSDTEVFLEGLVRDGAAWFSKVDAMFALGCFDPHANRLLLARDAFGEKPLYYTVQNGLFAFASELQALTLLPGFSPVVDDDAIPLYLAFQYIPAPRTIYRSCRKLPPGCHLEVGKDGVGEPVQYYRFTTGSSIEARMSIDAQADALEDILLRSLERRLQSDVPLGAFLSGGVDSSTAVALITRRLNRPIKTFSIGFAGTPNSEHEAARAIATHLGTEHRDRIVSPADIAGMSDKIAICLDEPNGDSSCLPTYLLSELTRQYVSVAISGDGGDEIFGGYDRYFHCAASVERNRDRIAQGSWHAGRDYYSSRILIFDDRDLSVLYGGMPTAAAAELSHLRRSIDTDPRPLVNVLRELDAANYLPGAVLAKVDRMSMQHSLEVRTPYLSVDVAEFGALLPASQISTGFSGKLVLKRLASRYLPANWMERPKMGFGLPMDSWADGSLRARTLDLVTGPEARLPQWLPRDAVRRFFEQRGEQISVYQLWSLRILEQWLRSHPAVPDNGLPARSGRSAVNATSLETVLEKEFDKDLASVYEALLTSQVRAIGWGAIAHLPYYLMQSPFPIDYIVDTDPAKWGTSICGVPVRSPAALACELPDTIVIVVFPFYSPEALQQILAQLRAIGPFRAMPPFRSELDGAMVRAIADRMARLEGEGSRSPAVRRAIEALDDAPASDTAALLRSIRAQLSQQQSPATPRRVSLVIGSLQAGGAERQICYLAIGLKQQGWDVAVLAFTATQPGAEHYEAMLAHAGVPLQVFPSPRDHFADLSSADPNLAEIRIASPLLKRMPFFLIHWTWMAYRRFAADRPELVICYLDMVNLPAGLGAMLAGVNHILLSGRNIHPGNFRNHYGESVEWMRELYRCLSTFPEVILTANSVAGARSYADWLQLPQTQVKAIPNGIPPDAQDAPSTAAVAAIRAAIGIGPETPLILGAFRLAEEKRPLLFVEVIRRLHSQGVRFKAAIAGGGPMAETVRAAVERLGLSSHLILLGVREDIRDVIAASDLVLHVAHAEGHPNVLMEAQLLGRPIVASAAEGTLEVLAPVHRPRQPATDDDGIELAAQCRAILDDLEQMRSAAAEAAVWVRGHFSIERLVASTLAAARLTTPK